MASLEQEAYEQSDRVHARAIHTEALRHLILPTREEVERAARQEWRALAYCETCRATIGARAGFHRAAGHSVK